MRTTFYAPTGYSWTQQVNSAVKSLHRDLLGCADQKQTICRRIVGWLQCPEVKRSDMNKSNAWGSTGWVQKSGCDITARYEVRRACGFNLTVTQRLSNSVDLPCAGAFRPCTRAASWLFRNSLSHAAYFFSGVSLAATTWTQDDKKMYFGRLMLRFPTGASLLRLQAYIRLLHQDAKVLKTTAQIQSMYVKMTVKRG